MTFHWLIRFYSLTPLVGFSFSRISASININAAYAAATTTTTSNCNTTIFPVELRPYIEHVVRIVCTSNLDIIKSTGWGFFFTISKIHYIENFQYSKVHILYKWHKSSLIIINVTADAEIQLKLKL